jgi:hypothetical protein
VRPAAELVLYQRLKERRLEAVGSEAERRGSGVCRGFEGDGVLERSVERWGSGVDLGEEEGEAVAAGVRGELDGALDLMTGEGEEDLGGSR